MCEVFYDGLSDLKMFDFLGLVPSIVGLFVFMTHLHVPTSRPGKRCVHYTNNNL